MKKSYHSNAVPVDDAMITRPIDFEGAMLPDCACAGVAKIILPARGDSVRGKSRNSPRRF